jgi:hypothetical protein
MRYDNRLGDAFWNSSEQGYFSYLLAQLVIIPSKYEK